MLLLTLLACQRLENADALTKPVVMQGLFLGMDLPEGVNLGGGDKDNGAFAYTAACQVFLAYLSGTGALQDSPVEGADVAFSGVSLRKDLPVQEQEDGKYLLTSVDGLEYVPEERVELAADVEGAANLIGGRTPEAPQWSISTTIKAERDVDVDLTGGGYDNLIVGVAAFDPIKLTGKLTWDNLPTAFEDVYAFTHPSRPVELATIDGREAFPEPGYYVVGVAGMEIAPAKGFEGVNATLSAFMAGQLSLQLITVE